LKSEHVVANVVAYLNRLVINFELLPTAVLQDCLALLVRTLVFFAPLLVLVDQGKQHKFIAVLARDLEDVDEFLENVRAGSNSQDSRALEGTVLLPFFDATFAEELSTVVTLHWFSQDL